MLVLTLMLFCFTLFFILIDGIHIEYQHIGSVKFEKLYLKLDKKLIFELGRLDVSSTDEQESKESNLDDLAENLQNIKLVLSYFQKIKIDEIDIGGYKGDFLFENEIFHMDTKAIEVNATLDTNGSTVGFNIHKALIKDFNISITGDAIYDLSSDYALLNGLFDINGKVSGDIRADLKKMVARYEINTKEFENLHFIKALADIKSKDVQAWLYDNVTGDSFVGTNIYGQVNLKNPTIDELAKLRAELFVKNCEIKFHPDLTPIKTGGLKATLSNNKLTFSAITPKYGELPVEYSLVEIDMIFGEEPKLFLSIKATSALDKQVSKILDAYKIKLPLQQLSSKTDAALRLLIDLNTINVDEANGTFITKDSKLKLNSLELFAKELHAELNNSQVYIRNSSAALQDFLNADVNMTIDTKNSKIYGTSSKNRFDLLFGKSDIMRLKDKNLDFLIDFSNKTRLEIEKLSLNAIFGDKENSFEIGDIKSVFPYSKLLQEKNITEGSLLVSTSDFKEFVVDGKLKNMVLPLSEKDGRAIRDINLSAIINKDKVVINSYDKRLNIEITNATKVKLNNYLIVVDEKDLEDDGVPKKRETMEVEATNSDIRLGKRYIMSDFFKYYTYDYTVGFEQKFENSKISYFKDGKKGKISAIHLSDRFLNRFFDGNTFGKGVYDLEAIIDNKLIKGVIYAKGAKIKNLTLMNNLFSLLDTAPSLVIFKRPGFSTDGYSIEDGNITFGYIDGYFIMENIDLKGSGVDIKGFGAIDTEKQTIDLKLKLLTLKSLSSIVSSIPLVGYIIMGDDGSVSTDVVVSGSLDDPKTESKIIENTIIAPVNIIERVLKTPFRLFE